MTQATSTGQNGGTEDYNPFAEEAKKDPEVSAAQQEVGNLKRS